MSATIKMRIDEELLAAVDAQAEADGMNRTQFVLAALRQRLANAPSLDGTTRLPAPKTPGLDASISVWQPPAAGRTPSP